MLSGYADICATSEDCSNKLPIKGRVSHDMLHSCDVVISEDHAHFISGHTKFEETHLSAVSQSNLGVCMSVCVHVCMSVCVHVCMSACVHVCMSACAYMCA